MFLSSNLLVGNIDVMDFASWLEEELAGRGWNRSMLSKRGKISAPQVTRILNREQLPGPDFCRAVATAFVLPPEFVMRKAGILPPKSEADPRRDEAAHRIDELPEHRKDDAIAYLRWLLGREDQSSE